MAGNRRIVQTPMEWIIIKTMAQNRIKWAERVARIAEIIRINTYKTVDERNISVWVYQIKMEGMVLTFWRRNFFLRFSTPYV